MTADEVEVWDDDFNRPFFAQDGGRSTAPESEKSGAGSVDDDSDPEARPYLLTGGRASAHGDVAMETIVMRTELGDKCMESGKLPSSGVAQLEIARILPLCGDPLSVAEVAVGINVALGVAQVLVGDMIADGLLAARSSSPSLSHDVSFLERLIKGVAAL